MLLWCQVQYNTLIWCPHYAGVNGSQSLFNWPLVTEIMACTAARGTTSGLHCCYRPQVAMWVQMTPLTPWAPPGLVGITENTQVLALQHEEMGKCGYNGAWCVRRSPPVTSYDPRVMLKARWGNIVCVCVGGVFCCFKSSLKVEKLQ